MRVTLLPLLACAGASLVACSAVQAQGRWAIALYGGFAYHIPTPLTIHQAGERDIELTARYATRPWTQAPYYVLRLGRWARGRAWELELIHHKLYLRNPPPEVQRFEVSHGYNLLVVNRALEKRGTVRRVGVGLVIAHPEATVRQRALPEDRGLFEHGYYVSGAVIQAAGARRLTISRGLFLAAEAKLTAAYARVPIEGGQAAVPNVALHGLLGIEYVF